MLRCIELGLGVEMLSMLTVGDVYDLCTEKMNDQEEYPLKGTQEDINSFFG